jgi:hypothetical protein
MVTTEHRVLDLQERRAGVVGLLGVALEGLGEGAAGSRPACLAAASRRR